MRQMHHHQNHLHQRLSYFPTNKLHTPTIRPRLAHSAPRVLSSTNSLAVVLIMSVVGSLAPRATAHALTVAMNLSWWVFGAKFENQTTRGKSNKAPCFAADGVGSSSLHATAGRLFKIILSSM